MMADDLVDHKPDELLAKFGVQVGIVPQKDAVAGTAGVKAR